MPYAELAKLSVVLRRMSPPPNMNPDLAADALRDLVAEDLKSREQ